MATICNGRLYHDKVVGDLNTLCKDTDVEKFPGTIGIAHSRTPSKGGREWAHPFLDCSGSLALCGEGSPGIFKEGYVANTSRIAAELIKEGHHFHSATRVIERTASATFSPSGERVHVEEVFCHRLESNLKKSGDMLKAMSKTSDEMKSESASLAIKVSYSREIFMTTVNQSLAIGWDEKGAYVATSSLTFPDSL